MPLHPPALPLPLGSLCSGYTALLFSEKAQLVPTLAFALALLEDSAASSSWGSLLPLSSFSPLFEYHLAEIFLAIPTPSSPTRYSLTHRFSIWATYPNQLGHFQVANARRLLVWVGLGHQDQEKQPGILWVLSLSLSTFVLLSCVSVESGARTRPILYLAMFPTPWQAASRVAQQVPVE